MHRTLDELETSMSVSELWYRMALDRIRQQERPRE